MMDERMREEMLCIDAIADTLSAAEAMEWRFKAAVAQYLREVGSAEVLDAQLKQFVNAIKGSKEYKKAMRKEMKRLALMDD